MSFVQLLWGSLPLQQFRGLWFVLCDLSQNFAMHYVLA